MTFLSFLGDLVLGMARSASVLLLLLSKCQYFFFKETKLAGAVANSCELKRSCAAVLDSFFCAAENFGYLLSADSGLLSY
jgi:hypothetical protein